MKRTINWKKITGTVPNPFKMFCLFKNVAYSLENGKTPSYLASHQVLDHVQNSQILLNMVKKRYKFNLPEPKRNRKITRYDVNVIIWRTVHYFLEDNTGDTLLMRILLSFESGLLIKLHHLVQLQLGTTTVDAQIM